MRFPVKRSRQQRLFSHTPGTPTRQSGKNKRTAVDFFRYTKIGDFDAPLVVDENVGALNVAVDDVSLVEVVEALEDLADKVFDEGFLKGTIIA